MNVIVQGNHDWYGKVLASVSTDILALDWRWNAGYSFSSTNVSTVHFAPGGAASNPPPPPLLSIFYIDTSPWVSECALPCCYLATHTHAARHAG